GFQRSTQHFKCRHFLQTFPAHALFGHRESQQHGVSRLLRRQVANRLGNRWRGGQRLSRSAAPACNEQNQQDKEKDRETGRWLPGCCGFRHLEDWHLQSSAVTGYTGSNPGSSRCPPVACSRKRHPPSPLSSSSQALRTTAHP